MRRREGDEDTIAYATTVKASFFIVIAALPLPPIGAGRACGQGRRRPRG